MTATIVCLHASQSGRLSFNTAGLLDAHLVCDACEEGTRHLPEQSAVARAQYMLPDGPGIVAA